MRRLIDRCAGIDVGQALLVGCVRVVSERGRVAEEVRSFGATTPDLVELRDWLASLGVTHVAMESTGCIGRRRITCWKTILRCCW
jgi:transposase